MPTNEEINKARLRGAIARDVADQQLLDPHQRAQNQADAALPLPRENTAAMGRHFSDTFPGDGQPQAAIQTAPPINSRTGQQPSIATNEQPRRVITTDAHARVIAPPVSVETAGTTLVVVVAQVLPPIGDDSEQLLVVTLVLSELPQTFNMTLVMIKQKTLEYNVQLVLKQSNQQSTTARHTNNMLSIMMMLRNFTVLSINSSQEHTFDY